MVQRFKARTCRRMVNDGEEDEEGDEGEEGEEGEDGSDNDADLDLLMSGLEAGQDVRV